MNKIILKKGYLELEKIKRKKIPIKYLSIRSELLEQMDLINDELIILNEMLDNYDENDEKNYENYNSNHYKYYLNFIEEEKYENLIIYELV